jgi:2-hydroxychromene-2-carboxylate isomerase
METAMQRPSLEFWYEFGSNYSYLSVMRIEALARQYGVDVDWKPFLLGPIFKSFGWNTSPFVLQKEKGAYAWKDMARQCARYGLPWKRPTTFPRGALLAIRVALLGAGQPWIAEYSRRMMQLNFVLDQDFDTPEVVGKVLADLGLPAASLLAEAQSDANKERLRAQIDAARSKGVFGAPTFFAGDEIFWGDDRLVDALQFAARRGEIPGSAVAP